MLQSILEDNGRTFLSLELFFYRFEVAFVLPNTPRNRYGETQKENEIILSKFGKVSHLPLRRDLKYLFFNIFFFIRRFRTEEDKIIISITEYAGYISRFAYPFVDSRTILIHSHQCIDVKRKTGFEYLKHKTLETFCKRFCDYYFACSLSEQGILNKEFKISDNKIILLRNYITREFSIIRKERKLFKDFIYFGRIVKEKQVNILLEVFTELDMLDKLCIVGEGNCLNQYKEKYVNSNFKGRIPHADLLPFLNNFGFYISASQIEGLSFSLLESMYMGLVPIVSNVPGHNDVIKNKYNGFLFSNKKELKKIIENLSTIDSTDIIVMSKNAIQVSEASVNYSENDFKKFIKIIYK